MAHTKVFKLLSISLCLLLTGWELPAQTTAETSEKIVIMEGTYETREHFIITTPRAVYYYDKAGGGFSRMIDRNGNDWIDFKMEPRDSYPASAASSYRGLPNLVFHSADDGAGHPGHDQCISVKSDHHTILTESKSGRWAWECRFYEYHVEIKVSQNDPDHPYWFLYEGVPGGTFQPATMYFGNNTGGPIFDQPDYFKGKQLTGFWQWVYFGSKRTDKTLYIIQTMKDQLPDTFSYLGNSSQGIQSTDGMVVFGFGRTDGAKPLMRSPRTFIFGFYEKPIKNKKQHRKLSGYIQRLLN
jgi:hypothetical protein